MLIQSVGAELLGGRRPREPCFGRLPVTGRSSFNQMTSIKRSSAVPLALVPALAALVGCNSGPAVVSGVDPCLPQIYQEAACLYATQHQGYYYGGMWYHHVYAMPMLFYHNGYSGYVRSGGTVRALSPSAYSPSLGGASAGRSTVVRGGFGGIGATRGFGGS